MVFVCKYCSKKLQHITTTCQGNQRMLKVDEFASEATFMSFINYYLVFFHLIITTQDEDLKLR